MRQLSFASIALAASLLIAGPTLAADDLIKVKSAHSVAQTMDNLTAAVEGAGAKVFGRVNHGGGADSVGIEIPDNELLIFGNPKLGSPAIRDAATIGLDLPLKAVAYEDADGQVWLVYRDPVAMGAAHGLGADHPTIKAMTGALGKLTGKATQ